MRTTVLVWQKLSLVEPFQGPKIIPLVTSAVQVHTRGSPDIERLNHIIIEGANSPPISVHPVLGALQSALDPSSSVVSLSSTINIPETVSLILPTMLFKQNPMSIP